MKPIDALRHVAATLAVLATSAFGLPVQAQEGGSIVVASMGGRMQDAQRKAFYAPFEKATGIKVIDTTGISLAKLKTMVMTKNVEWDVFMASPDEFYVFIENGYLQKLDFSQMDKKTIDEMEPHMVNAYGVGSMFYAAVIAYNTKKYNKENHPRSWADVWDVTKFPGPRILPAATYQMPSVEPALLADGAASDKLYPLDLDRAYRMLTKIRPNVIKWVSSGSAAPQALVDGEADIAIANHARIAQLRDEGAPVDYEWNQAIVSAARWAIPVGAKNYKSALKFIEFASRAEQQAEMAKQMPYGPVNRRASTLVSEKINRDSPMAPQNAKNIVVMDAESWGSKGPSGASYLEKNIELWNAWTRK